VVELLVSTGLIVTVAAMSASIFIKTTSFYTESISRSNVMESAKLAQEKVFDQLFAAKAISLQWPSKNQPVLSFVVPVELPLAVGQPSYLNGLGKVNWGAVEPTGAKLDAAGSPHRVTLTVVPAGTVTEKECKLDINQDGDRLDSYQTGSLVMRTTESKDTIFLPGKVILGQNGGGTVDIDGDRIADPLFLMAGEPFTDTNKSGVREEGETFVDSNRNGRWDGALAINLLAFVRDRDGQGHRFAYRTRVKLVHNQ
jgi:hypothetical protein